MPGKEEAHLEAAFSPSDLTRAINTELGVPCLPRQDMSANPVHVLASPTGSALLAAHR